MESWEGEPIELRGQAHGSNPVQNLFALKLLGKQKCEEKMAAAACAKSKLFS